MKKTILLITLLTMIQGCFTTYKPTDYISELDVSPDFSGEQIPTRPFLMAGVINRTQGDAIYMDQMKVEVQGAQTLETSMSRERNDVNFALATGDQEDLLKKVLFQYSQGNLYELDAKIMDEDRELLLDHWIVVASLESENLSRSTYEESTSNGGKEKNMTAERAGSVRLAVIDPENFREVWSGVVHHSARHHKSFVSEVGEIKDGWDLFFSVASLGDDRSPPEYPSRQDLIGQVGTKIAAAFPKVPKKEKE